MVCSTCNQTNNLECNNTPPATNVKCIVFTIFVVTIYWILPKNKWLLLFLLWFPYLMMAWYDFLYDCKRNELSPTYLMSFYEWAKPNDSRQVQIYKNWCPKWKNQVFYVDMAVLVLFILFMKYFFIPWNPKA